MQRFNDKIHPEIIKVIGHYFLDRLDQLSFEERANRLIMAVNKKNTPLLFMPMHSGEELVAWQQIEALEAAGYIDIEYGLKRTAKPKHDRRTRIILSMAAEEYFRTLLDRAGGTDAQQWASAVDKAELPEELKSALLRGRPIKIESKSYEEVLAHVSKRLPLVGKGMQKRQASALLFFGMSKVLDSRNELCAELGFWDNPMILHVHINPQKPFKHIWLIENYDTYLQLCKVHAFDDIAMVYSSGFAGSAEKVRRHGYSVVHYMERERGLSAELRERFKRWLHNNDNDEIETVCFYGDFDFSGISIYLALKRTIPEIVLSPHFNVMCKQVQEGNGHSPQMAGKQGQKDPGETGIELFDDVYLPVMRTYGFYDQEGVPFKSVVMLAAAHRDKEASQKEARELEGTLADGLDLHKRT